MEGVAMFSLPTNINIAQNNNIAKTKYKSKYSTK